jgi:DNA topoisomerase-3
VPRAEFNWKRGKLFDCAAAVLMYQMCVEEPLATVTQVRGRSQHPVKFQSILVQIKQNKIRQIKQKIKQNEMKQKQNKIKQNKINQYDMINQNKPK